MRAWESPIALIINEIISNALKYAFEEDEAGEIRVTLEQDDDYIILNIKDNGKGITNEELEAASESFGLELINTLVEQLDGSVVTNYKHGTSYNISFQLREKK